MNCGRNVLAIIEYMADYQAVASEPLTPPCVRVSYTAVHQIKEILSCVSGITLLVFASCVVNET